jgi:transmembrane sensor
MTTTMGTLDPSVAKAVEWMVLLRSGEASTTQVNAFAAWRASHPSHEAASQRIAQALGPFERLAQHGVPGAVIQQTMARAGRRAVLRSALACASIGATGFFSLHAVREYDVLADQRTGTAQRLQTPLPDGSSLLLDARTAVDLAFDASQRAVTLRRGRLLADAARHPINPLFVRTPQGSVQGNGARFVTQALDQQTRVTVLSGTVVARANSGEQVQAAENRQIILSTTGGPQSLAALGTEALWTQGLVALDNEPLGHLVAALQPYRNGVLRIDPKAAQIRVSGVFSLDDSESTLRALAQTQPVRIRERTSYWVTISAV